MIREKTMKRELMDNIFLGRALVSAYLKSNLNPEMRKKNAPDINPPIESMYILWFDIYEVTGIDEPTLLADLQVGTTMFSLAPVIQKKKKHIWKADGRLPSVKISLPRIEAQIPDIFLHLSRKSILGGKERIAFLRIPFAVAVKDGVDVKIKWRQMMILDINSDLTKRSFALFSLNIGLAHELDKPRPMRPSHKKGKYEIWVHVVKARNLPIAESGGKSDPYAALTVNGKFKRTHFIDSVISPEWNELIRFRTRLPVRIELSNDILVEVYDMDKWIDALLGELTVNPGDMRVAVSDDEKMPPPQWYRLTRGGKMGLGEIMISFLIHKVRNVNKKFQKPALIKPISKKLNVYVTIIGIRKLQPFKMSNPAGPLIQLRIGNSEVEETGKGFQQGKKTDANFNFLELKRLVVDIPIELLYAPSLDIAVLEDFSLIMGGRTLVGNASISLARYLPWVSKEEREVIVAEEEKNMFRCYTNQEKFIDIGVADCNIEDKNAPIKKKEEKDDEEEEYIAPIDCYKIERDELKMDPTASNFQTFEEITLTTDFQAFISENDNLDEEDEAKLEAKFQDVEEDYGRSEVFGNFEKELPIDQLPYEILKLNRNDDSGYLFAGILKTAIRVSEFVDEEGDDEILDYFTNLINDFNENDTLLCRLYILNANHLSAKKYFSDSSDPYIWIRQYEMSTEYKFVNRIYTNNLNPEIMTSYPVPISFPDNVYLRLGFWHKGGSGAPDELIGETEVDLENRFFHPKYRQIVKNNIKNIPVEKRTLRAPGVISPQGAVRMWIEVLTLDQAQENPPEELQAPTSEIFDMRVVIWNTHNIPLGGGKKVNIRVAATINDMEAGTINRQTDVHYNSRDGFGEFNWRMIFRLRLPSEFPTLSLTAMNVGMLSEDAISSASIDLAQSFNEVHRLKSDKKLPKAMIQLSNPSQPGKDMGKIEMEIWILPASEADLNPVGQERNEPNKDPYLPMPESGRSMTDWLSLSLPSLDLFGGLIKKLIILGILGGGLFLVLFLSK